MTFILFYLSVFRTQCRFVLLFFNLEKCILLTNWTSKISHINKHIPHMSNCWNHTVKKNYEEIYVVKYFIDIVHSLFNVTIKINRSMKLQIFNCGDAGARKVKNTCRFELLESYWYSYCWIILTFTFKANIAVTR